uniref:Uncharacterized protein n=1 Tax=Oryza glumipatula TaxID=40148 RepID=A0A0E0AQL1_9ORYZ
MTHRQATPRQQSAARPPPPPIRPVSSPAALDSRLLACRCADLHPASRGGAGVLLLPPHSLTGEHPNPSHPVSVSASASNFVSSPAACADPHPASRGGARRPPSSTASRYELPNLVPNSELLLALLTPLTNRPKSERPPPPPTEARAGQAVVGRGGEERRMAKLGPGQGLGCEAAVGSLAPSRKREYKACNKLTEGKRPLYAIGFNFLDVRYYEVFATVGGNRVTTYSCLKDGNFAILQAYIDEDKDESFYTLSWACDLDGTPLLVAAGSNGIIRVINCATEKLLKTFVGHGDSINEIRTQALKPSLIISASKDESVRLWNVHTGICILIFAGAGGHRNEVLSVDFHPSDIYRIASCGMDNTVKIWSMKEFWPYVEQSFTWTDLPSKFPTKYVQFPSVDNEIVLWEPKTKEQSPGEGSIDILQKYPVPECDIWFIKFSCDFHFNQLAIGNREGKVYVWEVQSSPPVLTARLTNPQCKSAIRQTAVSFDGSTILACSEDGSIWRWDEVDHPKA